MSTLTETKPKAAVSGAMERVRGWVSPLNLHWAGVGLLAAVNLYLLAHMAFLWQKASSNNQDAQAQQRITLRAAEIAAEPLRGLDAKLDRATKDADRFYKERLPDSNSDVYAEIGALTKKQNVRYTRAQYTYEPVLAGTADQLTVMHIDSSLSGDYRPLVQFINALERDKMFFVINAVTLTGQQSGMVNLRLRMTTYLRGRVNELPGEASGGAATRADYVPPKQSLDGAPAAASGGPVR
jgi:hypothetical protein